MTSVNAVEPVLGALARAHRDPAALRWAAVGDATAAALAAAGIGDVIVPETQDGAALAARLPVDAGAQVFLPRADIADPVLPAALRARGAIVHEVVAYRTLEAPGASRARLAAVLDEGPVDVLLATSGSVARGFAALADDPEGMRVLGIPVVAAGERSARVAREAGYATVIVAPTPDAASLAAFTARALGHTPLPDPDGVQ